MVAVLLLVEVSRARLGETDLLLERAQAGCHVRIVLARLRVSASEDGGKRKRRREDVQTCSDGLGTWPAVLLIEFGRKPLPVSCGSIFVDAVPELGDGPAPPVEFVGAFCTAVGC
jgi:hypothetical protein